ncbi:hypothetical protein VNO77_07081 [Canavalia gladiata]|uniref:Uncharacterized protein n=1 Tax=Canavalia gladiata TaxID=3824 RepID=A0AAN9QWF7_CANGL
MIRCPVTALDSHWLNGSQLDKCPSTDDKMILHFSHFQGQWSLHSAQSNIIITCKETEMGPGCVSLQLKPILPQWQNNHASKKFFQIKKQEPGQNKQSCNGRNKRTQKGKKWIYARLVTLFFFSALVSTNGEEN